MMATHKNYFHFSLFFAQDENLLISLASLDWCWSASHKMGALHPRHRPKRNKPIYPQFGYSRLVGSRICAGLPARDTFFSWLDSIPDYPLGRDKLWIIVVALRLHLSHRHILRMKHHPSVYYWIEYVSIGFVFNFRNWRKSYLVF